MEKFDTYQGPGFHILRKGPGMQLFHKKGIESVNQLIATESEQMFWSSLSSKSSPSIYNCSAANCSFAVCWSKNLRFESLSPLWSIAEFLEDGISIGLTIQLLKKIDAILYLLPYHPEMPISVSNSKQWRNTFQCHSAW